MFGALPQNCTVKVKPHGPEYKHSSDVEDETDQRKTLSPVIPATPSPARRGRGPIFEASARYHIRRTCKKEGRHVPPACGTSGDRSARPRHGVGRVQALLG